MKILFIAPPLPRANTTGQPLGFGYMASRLRQEGFNDIEILDACSQNMSLRDTISFARERAPDVLGLTAMTVAVNNARRIAAAVKADRKGMKVVLGGVHPSVMPHEVIADPNVDAVVINEGDYTFPEMIKGWEGGRSLEGVAGCVFKEDGEVVFNPRRPRVTDLNALPFPARDLMPMHIYKAGISFPPSVRLRTLIYSARGCPNDCYFCASATVWGDRRCIMRSADNVLDEIESVVDEFGVRGFEFVDELTTLRKDRLRALCEGIRQRRLDIKWVCSSTVRQMDYETSLMMKAAGCSMVLMGVESGSPEIRRQLNKRITNEEIIDAFDATRRAGLRRCACFMIGAPGETAATVEESIQLAKRIKADRTTLNVVTPYPGTQFHRELVDPDAQLDWDEAFSSDPDRPESACVFYPLSDLSYEEINHLWRKFRREVELAPNLLNWRMNINRLTNARNWRHLWRNFRGAVELMLER
jgi:anaerobic magnesium-protoporphyrin IX monomethyl ester cyclase